MIWWLKFLRLWATVDCDLALQAGDWPRAIAATGRIEELDIWLAELRK